ncbi:SDR family NAD(P)-dependent oxidoreductase [Paenibacillus radicis (ex Gao et al. 2016)]|uniref:Short-chain dehydrogenase/reductase n=1 Tax=Paenibacillus radicis (ex Gao et al. 2016) TaxID=1737354 RepID=A0A917M1V4_9BACL|nr:SDR family NAD(P)-dependent oxidoreductase [Paenibacillus radicis (ex Gao et al. 2016)]GGG69632.1 short-chain dehydrogenase/reductase [Paenibacillus radicis (ex Gao et al. 2016)]
MSKVWLITGSGSGLGRNITEAALAKGERVVATARNIEQLDDLVKQYGDQIRVATLDVTVEEAAQAAVQLALDAFGRLDVLVNNAGYGDIRPFEETSSEDFKKLMDTCFYGVVYLTRAALPIMRNQRSGHILQISSVGGRLATPGSAAYHAAKWAIGGFTEALAMETAHLGIKISALEPGGMRTNWVNRAIQQRPPMLPDYEASVGQLLKMMDGLQGQEKGDPVKVAEVVLQLAYADELPAHLLLGIDAVQGAQFAEKQRAADAERWYEVSRSTEFE